MNKYVILVYVPLTLLPFLFHTPVSLLANTSNPASQLHVHTHTHAVRLYRNTDRLLSVHAWPNDSGRAIIREKGVSLSGFGPINHSAAGRLLVSVTQTHLTINSSWWSLVVVGGGISKLVFVDSLQSDFWRSYNPAFSVKRCNSHLYVANLLSDCQSSLCVI